MDPGQPGPGAHSHEANEELSGVTHDFENRTARAAGVLNGFVPGGFESNMEAIVAWYREPKLG